MFDKKNAPVPSLDKTGQIYYHTGTHFGPRSDEKSKTGNRDFRNFVN